MPKTAKEAKAARLGNDVLLSSKIKTAIAHLTALIQEADLNGIDVNFSITKKENGQFLGDVKVAKRL